ncbi:MAG: DUF4258 domain-containing protein [Nitrososphaerales archaeon]
MTIQFSHHALEKAHRRGVSMSRIYQALKTPDELYEDIEHKTLVAVKKTDEKYIILAYRKEAELVKLITIYYTTKLDKIIKSKTVRGVWKRIK